VRACMCVHVCMCVYACGYVVCMFVCVRVCVCDGGVGGGEGDWAAALIFNLKLGALLQI